MNTEQEVETGRKESGMPDTVPFRRLHPLSIIARFIAILSQNIIVIAVLYFSVMDQNPFYTALAATAIIGVGMAIAILIWSRFSYQVGGEEIRIKSGVLSRNNRSIPYERIQDVSLEQKLVPRLLGLATVKLETGSGGGEDGKLDALALADAEALRDSIRDRKSGALETRPGSHSEATADEDEVGAPPLFTMDNKRLLIAGLFNFSFIILAILGTIAQNLDFLLPGDFFDPGYWLGLWAEQEFVDGMSFGIRLLGVAGAIFSLIAIGVVSGIIRTFIREYGFRLDRVTNGFRRRRGLFTLTDVVMPIHRVQAAILRTGPIRERFGWFHLKFQSLAGDTKGETDHSAAPCARMAELDPILDETEIRLDARDTPFQPVHPGHWWRNAVILLLVLGAVAVGNGLFVHPGLGAIALLWLPLCLWLFLNWKHHKYALTDQQLFVRSGWWRRKLTALPRRKIQTVDVSQSPLDHPLDLATVTVGVAGGSPLAPLKIMDIPFAEAMALRTRLIGSRAV